MEVTGGSLNFGLGIDTSGLEGAVNEILKRFYGLGDAAEEAGKRIDGAFDGAKFEAGIKQFVEEIDSLGVVSEEAMSGLSRTLKEAFESTSELDAEGKIAALEEAFAMLTQQIGQMDAGPVRDTLQGVADGFSDTISAMKGASESTTQEGAAMEQNESILVRLLGGQTRYNEILGKMPQGLQGAIRGLNGMTGAAKAFIATPLGAVIGALVLAVSALKTWFGSTVEGQLKFAKVSGYVSGVLGQLKEIVISVGKSLFKAFSEPKEAIAGLWKAIKENVVNRFKAVGDMGVAVGKIIKSAFTFDWEGVKQGAKDMMESFTQSVTGIDGLGRKAKDYLKGVNEAAKENSRIAKEEKQLEIDRSEWEKRRSELEMKSAEARNAIYRGSAQERKKAIADYKSYSEEIMKGDSAILEKEIELQESKMALTSNTIEDENRLRELQANRNKLQMEHQQRLMSVTRRENSLINDGVRGLNKEMELARKVADELGGVLSGNRASGIELMTDGYAKTIAKIKEAYETEIAEADRLAAKWSEAQGGKLTGEQEAALGKMRSLAAERMVKDNADALNAMLSDYMTYEQRHEAIAREYAEKIGAVQAEMGKTDQSGNLVHTAEELEEYARLMETLANGEAAAYVGLARQQFDLDMEVFDSSYFDSVDSKMQALNGVYAAYISNLTKAGASQEQLNAVTREWNLLTGKSAQLNAKLEDLEQEKALAVERGDIDLVKALNGEMSKLRKEQDKMQKDGEKKDFKTNLLDWWDENKKDLIVDGIDKIGGSIRQLGEASGNTGLKDLGEAVEGIGGLVHGFAQGGLIDGIVNAVSMIADEVVNVISANKQLEQAIDSANVDSWADRMDEMMQTDGIFGSDSIAQVNASVKVMREAQKQLQDVWKGGKVNAQDRSGFANFFGIKDDYRELGDMARELGRDLYDSYGNLNSDTLQAILDTYSDLGAEDRKWMEEAIAYSDEYAEAMENVASYLENLFGGVAGDIADKMVDAFIETGNAAVDLGDVVSDVGKKMAKDLIKSMIISTYFEGMEDDFKRRIAENGMNAETSSYIIGEVSKAVQAIEGDMTYWNNVIASLSGLWSGAAEDASATLGTSLGAASQESIDMMTGQLNAIRTHQITIESRVDSVLLSLAGIRQDMNSNARNAEGYLDKIEINTRSTNNSLIRGFGL